MAITRATLTDVPELVALINSAYRGEGAKQGWTTEADMIEGTRIDHDSLTEELNDPNVTLFKNTEDGKITGCVYVQKRNDKLYLGMLTVSPTLQAKGLGKQLLQAAEEHGRAGGLKAMTMTVITKRHELIAYYERRGYAKTGEVISLNIPEQFGRVKEPLEMYIFDKPL
ncbi:GNAT family N-acetyltransferase [Mucilaginibacter conchicola]|uniref:GNAT family N-acetyltransferase n=1 Tax=Mucilaginibacter conchicola TaxID=2303333 RepID=A0A372P012_9SPHI|nr:GNAT family N-acetyltransferase [Mucilaginibacter conchicola]RFZ95077.1 GNAT family N-acetyltransferase [Mucilaginibacter conchicola]